MTPDPADRMRAVREAIASEGQRLANLMAHTDNQGHPADPETTEEETNA